MTQFNSLNVKLGIAAALALSLLPFSASAHHSFSMFDATTLTTVTGTVKEFDWTNPHTWLNLTIADPSGKLVSYQFEGGSPSQLTASGWKQDSVKVGDKITLGFHPMKDGSHGGQLLNVTLTNGQVLCQGADCRKILGGAAAAAPGPKAED
jgi:hypothetical protein